MSKTNDGGPAFARPAAAGSCSQQGLSVRDYFAASAMQGFNANSHPDMLTWSLERIAKHSYKQADAMLAARGAQ
ncbi:hypothetical protein M5J07_17720 [Achromobacter mucicolens]|uniref:hypothetical protein n=1 Tax=Achromobacter mucicolens TaxID=1389922 RepID=UPI0020A56722|nr:hypothetical protein [Achromobacter mucicolens]MCP2516782.1 hypothetical protein [Achromobacter mucicolens]